MDRLEVESAAQAPPYSVGMVSLEALQHAEVRDQIAPLLERACVHSHGHYDVETAAAAIAEGEMQLWAVVGPAGVRAIFCTEIDVSRAAGPVAWVVLMGGDDFRDWGHLQAKVQAWAVAQGCVALRMLGRKGWARLLPDWKATATVFELELERHGRQN